MLVRRHMARFFLSQALSSFIPGPANVMPTLEVFLVDDNRGIHQTLPRPVQREAIELAKSA